MRRPGNKAKKSLDFLTQVKQSSTLQVWVGGWGGGGRERRGAGGKGEEAHRNFLELIIIIGTGRKSIVMALSVHAFLLRAGGGLACSTAHFTL